MRNITTFIAFVLMICMGCNSTQERNSETAAPQEQRTIGDTEQAEWEQNIQLDEGRKWRVDRRTTEGVGRMSEILEQSEANTVEEYRTLGERLQEERSGVDNSRTSNDASNDNLNIYLDPLDQKIRQLQEVRSVEEGARLKSELEKHLYAYSNYFV